MFETFLKFSVTSFLCAEYLTNTFNDVLTDNVLTIHKKYFCVKEHCFQNVVHFIGKRSISLKPDTLKISFFARTFQLLQSRKKIKLTSVF